jgi:hypothetical protein
LLRRLVGEPLNIPGIALPGRPRLTQRRAAQQCVEQSIMLAT